MYYFFCQDNEEQDNKEQKKELKTFQGDWVDQDLMKTILQSMIIAGEKLLAGIDTDIYRPALEKLAELREKLNISRVNFHDYKFENHKNDLFVNLAKEAAEFLSLWSEKLMKLEPVDPTFVANFYRIYLVAQIHRLRSANMNTNLSECQRLILEIYK